jgi:hypothetical protein
MSYKTGTNPKVVLSDSEILRDPLAYKKLKKPLIFCCKKFFIMNIAGRVIPRVPTAAVFEKSYKAPGIL